MLAFLAMWTWQTSHPFCETVKIRTLMIAPHSTWSETIWSTEVANLRVCKAGLSQVAAKGKGRHDQSQMPIPSFRPSPSVAFASEFSQLWRPQSLLPQLSHSYPAIPDRCAVSSSTEVHEGGPGQDSTQTSTTNWHELTWTDDHAIEFYRVPVKGIANLAPDSNRSFGYLPRCWTVLIFWPQDFVVRTIT